MRILFVLEHFHPYIGGVEFLFLQLCEELVKEGHQVEVVTSLYDKNLLQSEQYRGITINRVDSRNRFTFIIFSLPQIFRSAKSADIIHTTTYTAALPAFIIGAVHRKKTVITFHEFWGELWKKLPYLGAIERVAFRSFEKVVSKLPFDKVVGVSDFTKDALLNSGVAPSRVQRIYNGLDYDRLSKIKARYTNENSLTTAPNFIFIGRIGVSKGIDLLLPAVARVFEVYPAARLHMVIPKVPLALYSQIRGEIDQLNKGDNITIYHNLPKAELYNRMLAADFIVIPSYSEGFGFVAAEACALAIPVVTSQQGALSEVISGYYVPFTELNAIQLADAIIKAIRKEFTFKKPTTFTLEKSVSEYIRLYNTMLNG